jgi:hypothetical protein
LVPRSANSEMEPQVCLLDAEATKACRANAAVAYCAYLAIRANGGLSKGKSMTEESHRGRTGSVTAAEVVEVLARLGGEAEAVEIAEQIERGRGGVPDQYEDRDIFHKTINQVIQYRCSHYQKFRFPNEEYFEWVGRGRYHLTEEGRRFLTRHAPSLRDGTSISTEADVSSLAESAEHSDGATLPIAEEDDEGAFVEGRERYRIHRTKERDPRIVRLVKARRLAEEGCFVCDVCGFNFERTYGERGRGFVEAHHTVPLSELEEETITREQDIALVCSNCHRMLHRGKPLLSVAELQSIVRILGGLMGRS